jgi:hypothetical protein
MPMLRAYFSYFYFYSVRFGSVLKKYRIGSFSGGTGQWQNWSAVVELVNCRTGLSVVELASGRLIIGII